MGTYGLLRFSIPIAPDAFVHFVPLLVALSLIGIIYGDWVAFQTDFKNFVAYSSVSHLGFVVLGICVMNPEGLTGSMLQMIDHGLSTGALFLLVGILYGRRRSRAFTDFEEATTKSHQHLVSVSPSSITTMPPPPLAATSFLNLLGTQPPDVYCTLLS